MDYVAYILGVALLLSVLAFNVRKVVIFEYQQGLLYKRGKFVALLPPGEHFYFRPWHTVQKVDTRILNVTLPGQEVLSADNVGLKLSLAASYRVVDPYLAFNKVANYPEALYLLLQMNLRDVIGALDIDDLLIKRAEIGKLLHENSVGPAAEIGLELLWVNLKDVMFPGELKNIFAQVVNARKEGLAALERARGESAALRNLANAASLFDSHPHLLQLRLFQVLEKSSGNTVVLLSPEGADARRVLEPAAQKSAA